MVLACAAGKAKDSMLRLKSASDREKGAAKPSSSRATTARKRDAPGADVEPETAVEKAIEMASVAGRWAIETGERHGKRLLQISRAWVTGETRQDEARLEDAVLGEGDPERHGRGIVADAVTEKEGQLGLSNQRDSSSSAGSARSARERPASGADGAGSDTEGHGEEAWRRGTLNEQVKPK